MSEGHASCRFYVSIGSESGAVFTEVSGLQVEIKTEDYVEGGNNLFVHKLPGRVEVGNLTLKRGLIGSNALFTWLMQVASGTIVKKNVTVYMYGTAPKGKSEPQQVAAWTLVNAYPVRWTGPQFVADSTTAAIETLELAHEGLQTD